MAHSFRDRSGFAKSAITIYNRQSDGSCSHRRPAPTLPRTSRRPTTNDQRPAKYIDVHRSIAPLERPHQPHRHPPPRRNRNPPLRRIPLRGPPTLPRKDHVGAARRACLKRSPRSCQGRAKLGQRSTDRHRLRRRLPRSPHKNLGARGRSHSARIQPKESNLPARSSAQFNIDGHQCIRRPRRSLPQPTRRRSNSPRSRAVRNSPPQSCPPGRTRRPPGPPDRPSPASASPQPGSRTSLDTPHPNPPLHKSGPGHWHKPASPNGHVPE